MRWLHPATGRSLRLGYCMNLRPAEDLDGVLAALAELAVPLRDRLGARGPFGVGLYLPAALARELAADDGRGAAGRARLAGFLDEHGLDPFTFNAFPAAGFARPGLKQRVFEPTWLEDERLAFTRDVARVAAALARPGAGHVSVSTHAGSHASRAGGAAERARVAHNLARAALELARLAEEGGPPVVLSVEPEPRSSANDTGELAELLARARAVELAPLETAGVPDPAAALARHLGACLDLCHAAVEFESTEGALANASAGGGPIGKVQVSSALSLPAPGDDPRGQARLLALDEPVYLHQVTARTEDGELLRAGDLPELARRVERGDARWLAAREWRCHFHVPVDIGGPLDPAEAGGLATTRSFADVALARLLADPARAGTDELHLEIETYTWDVLPREARREGARLDGLEREVRHVCGRLEAAGWRRADASPEAPATAPEPG